MLISQIKVPKVCSYATSGGIGGGGGGAGGTVGGFAPHPTCPQSEEKTDQNQPFLDFCPLRNTFCPFDVPPQENFWCHHCMPLHFALNYSTAEYDLLP